MVYFSTEIWYTFQPLNTTGEIVADHVWFTIGKKLSCVFGNIGKQVTFDARVSEYTKGYSGRRIDVFKEVKSDYKLSNPTNVIILKNEE